MKKRILSFVLALLMMVSTVPAPVFAADGGEAAPVAETGAAPTTETTAPTEPEETTTPTEPVETTVPTEPVETTAPTEPAETTAPTEPAETTAPTEPAETTAPTEPAETTAPTEPAETTAPTEPAETTAPTEPAETTAPTEPPVEKPDIPAMFAMFAGRSTAEPQAEGDSECECPADYDTAEGHVATCPLYTCPRCGAREWHQTCPYEAHVGKYVKLIAEVAADCVYVSADPASGENMDFIYEEFGEDTIMRITDWHWNSGSTGLWYQVELYSGSFPESTEDWTWPVPAWILQDYTDDSYDFSAVLTFVDCCSHCGKPGCTTEHVQCDKCGEYDCTRLHFWCDRCNQYDCGKSHLICRVCDKVDCTETHVFCGYCNDYDCGKTHGAEPETAPVIPDAPAFTPNEKVSLADAKGNPVSRVTLPAGTKTSLSAWTDLQGTVTYRWQVCYDREKDLWVNIQGQTGKGILISPAMLLSVAQDNEARIRCVVTDGQQTRTGDAIPVALTAAGGNSSGNSASLQPIAEGDGTENLQKVNVIIEYVFTDGKIAANPRTATLPAGVAYAPAEPVIIPNIPGYNPEIGESATDGNAVLNDYQLTLSFTAEEMQSDRTVRVVYKPAPVKVIIRHYQQNVDNDEYTLKESEEKSLTTGTVVGNVHKSYDGFYNLNYEKPTVAADGSTVLEIKYDRYYYLMKFDLGGGYGVDPIYARYGDSVEIGEPTRPGYHFAGWADANGNTVTIPDKVPKDGGTYYANWNALSDTEYTVAYWIRNDDGTRTYIGAKIEEAMSGSTVSGSDDLDVETNACGMPEHRHTNCAITCPLNEHAHGDGYCLYNCGVTFHNHTSGCNCTQGHATHSRNCYNFTSANVNPYASNNYGSSYVEKNGFVIYRRQLSNWGQTTYYYYVKIGNGYYQINNYSDNTSLAYTLNCHVHSNACCSIPYHDHSDCECIVVPHAHGTNCYDCGAIEHTHSDDCKTDLAKYVDFIEADENVTVKGDGSTTVNVYYKYRTYTIRFIYARVDGTGYNVATLTNNGVLTNCSWSGKPSSSLPSFIDPSGKTERSSVKIGNNTYYYISLQARFGENIASIWPSANIGNAGDYRWGSWAAAAGTGYRQKYGDSHANIVGPYPVMSADMIVDNPEKLADGTYLAQNMIAWWGKSTDGIAHHAYHNYFELLPDEDKTGAVLHNGKYYKLVETYTFTAAHNGTTRVDPIYFNGFVCINDTSGTSNDTQANSKNYDNEGNCEICGDDCDYCNDFYYDRNVHKLYFWNYNGPLQDGNGSDVLYGSSLQQHGEYVDEEFMNQEENYPEGLEPDAYEFAGWYTTAECHDGTEMDWTTTMPDADMTVYAKWVPVLRTVRYYMSLDSLKRGEDIPAEMKRLVKEAITAGTITHAPANDPYTTVFAPKTLSHGAYIGALNDPKASVGYEEIHPKATLQFVGWFYLNDEGEETAFDPENMPVKRDLNLYGKWISNVLCPYEIRYILDANRNGIQDPDETTAVADSVTGSTLAGNSRTFYAKGDKDLYADYQEGYFPNVASHTIEFNALDESGVVFTFLYKEAEKVPYTVKYLEKGTNNVLAPEVTYPENKKAVVTENFKVIPGYMPDAYQKSIPVVPDEDNVITFYYTADTVHAPVHVVHYIQNVDGDGYTVYQESTDLNTVKDTDYSAGIQNIPGFTFDRATANDEEVEPLGDKVTAKVPASGLELKLYYNRNTFNYKVQYLEYGTNTVLAPTKTITGIRYNKTVTENAIDIQKDLDGDGVFEDFQLYEPEKNPQSATIVDNNTVITFYYIRCTQTLTVTKTVVGAGTSADPNQKFAFTLQIHSNSGYHQNTYAYTKSGTNEEDWMAPKESDKKILEFTLKAGQTITIEGLPTAEYTVREVNVPENFIADIDAVTPGSQESLEFTLTKTEQVNVTCVNTSRLGKLTIKKTGAEAIDENQTFIFDVMQVIDGKEKHIVTVTINGNGNVTIEDLPIGQYKVTERTDWSWRYTPDGNGKSIDLVAGADNEVIFKNTRGIPYWLSGDNFNENQFNLN